MKQTLIFIAVVALVSAAVVLVFVNNYFLPQNNRETNNTDVTKTINEIGIRLIAEGFSSPIAFVSANDGTERMFLADQAGLIRVIDSNGQVLTTPFLDLRDKLVSLSANYDERGLLGLAFHPDFKNNGRFFVYYSAPLRSGAPSGWNHTSVIAEFKVGQNNLNIADKNSEKIIMQIDEPQSNHNGGHITFGPDGYLYIPLGDGGAADDVALGHTEDLGNAQDLTKLLGKILRIDINSGNPYSIPQDNPFSGGGGRAEIFAYGFRNPYHISFDSAGSRRLFAADVGQNLWEEIDVVEKGKNYGWNKREGNYCFDSMNPNDPPATCPGTGANGELFINPILNYKNSRGGGIGTANVGGYIYRGGKIPELAGKYVFADFSKGGTAGGSVFLATEENASWSFKELKISNTENGELGMFIKGLGRDGSGELYLLVSEALGPSGNSGKIYKMVSP